MDDKDENYVRPVPAREFIDSLEDFKQGELRNIEIIPTLRDQMAMAALTGLCANTLFMAGLSEIHEDDQQASKAMAKSCWDLTDAMMKAREQADVSINRKP